MSLRMKLVLNAVIGGWGGLLAWAILDLLTPLKVEDLWMQTALNGAVIGMCIGALVGSFDGLIEMRPLLFLREIIAGALFGLFGGVSGLLGAQFVFQSGLSIANEEWMIALVRVPGWAMFGLMIGMMEGVQMFSLRRMWMGGVGGLIGGIVGSGGFVLVAFLVDSPWSRRAIGFVLLGASVGFFAAWLPMLFRRAWIRVASGRDESQEFLLDKGAHSIGRSDLRDVRLRDNAVAPKHAEIRQAHGQYFIHAQPGQTVYVNETPLAQPTPLADQARLRVGTTRLTFRRKK